MNTKESITALLEHDDKVKVAGIDIDGVLRGKIMSKTKFLSSIPDGFGFCSVVFGWDLHDKVYTEETTISTSENGFADVVARIDLDSMRRIPWEDDIPLFMVDFIDPVTHAPLSVCPRSLLKRVKGEFERVQVQPMVGIEYEFFCFKETPESLVEKKHVGLTPLTPGMFGYSLLRPTLNQTYFYALFNECAKFGIPVEGLHTETGPGVLEAALEYGDALTLCDRAQLFKLAAKQLGAPHGITASFMAKPHNNLPGCGGHVHFSLRDTRTGENLFYDADAVDDAVDGGASTAGMSTVLKQFLAGVLQGLPSMLPIFAPTVNSYKRLVENYWAPTVVTWGRENRTAALRVIMPPACSPSSARIEMRVPGADANATLAVTAVLACGLYGIRTKLELPRGAAGDATQDRSFERLGGDLWTATNAMAAKDSLARQVLGDEFVNHYVATRRHEWREWTMAVTDWEVKRYLETV